MARFYPVGGAGGIASLDFVTAEAGDILGGKVGADKDGEPVNGLLVLSGNAAASDVSSGKTFYTTDPKTKLTGTLKECGQAQTAGGWGSGGSGSDAYFAMNRIPEGIYRAGGTDWGPEVRMKQSDVRSAIGATNSANWRSTVTIAGLKGTMPQQGGSTTTPGTGNKTIVSANRFVTGNIIVAGDADLKAANIKKGVNIFGVTGTFEGWVPTATDLYLRGNNPAGFSAIGSGIEFQTGAIYLENMTSSLRCSKSYNFAPYSKLNVEMNFVNVGSTGYRKALRLIKGTESGGDQLATFETSDIRSPGTYTLSINVSSLQLTTPFVLYISTGTMSSNTPSYIYHVWFS